MKELTFEIIDDEQTKFIGFIMGYGFELENGSIYIRDRENKTIALFSDVDIKKHPRIEFLYTIYKQ